MPPTLERLVLQLAKLPGVGTRTARRYALALLAEPETRMAPLAQALQLAASRIRACSACGNLDEQDPCSLCRDPKRDPSRLVVVERVADLWALERSPVHQGLYQVLGGTLSALAGIGPEALRLDGLVERLQRLGTREVILALSATVEGQTTALYVMDLLAPLDLRITQLGQGLPMGGALDYLDDGTLAAAFRARRQAGEADSA